MKLIFLIIVFLSLNFSGRCSAMKSNSLTGFETVARNEQSRCSTGSQCHRAVTRQCLSQSVSTGNGNVAVFILIIAYETKTSLSSGGHFWDERCIVLLEHYGLNSCHSQFLLMKQIILTGYLKLKLFIQLLIMKFVHMSVAFLTVDQTVHLLLCIGNFFPVIE